MLKKVKLFVFIIAFVCLMSIVFVESKVENDFEPIKDNSESKVLASAEKKAQKSMIEGMIENGATESDIKRVTEMMKSHGYDINTWVTHEE